MRYSSFSAFGFSAKAAGNTNGGRCNRHKPSTKSFDDSPAAIKACMISAAKSIRFYQAARWTIKKCRDNQSLIRTSWIGKDDKLPAKLDDSYNLDQVKHHLSSHFQPLTTEQHIAEVYSEFVKLFSPDAFYEGFEYRKWFHGKNLLAGLSRVLPLRGQNDILDGYYKWSVRHVDLKQFPDLEQLQGKLRELARSEG